MFTLFKEERLAYVLHMYLEFNAYVPWNMLFVINDQ